MKVIIDGSKISFAKIKIFLEGKCLYAGEISRNCFETDVSVLSNQEMLLHFAFFDGEEDDSEIEFGKELLDDTVLMRELQYPYDTVVLVSSDMETLTLVPEKVDGFEDFIVFVPDEDLKAEYIRNVSDNEIKEIISKHTKSNIRMIKYMYPVCLVISAILFYIGNTTESYTLTRALCYLWFALIVFPIILFYTTNRDLRKMKKYLTQNLRLPSDWRKANKMDPMEKVKADE